MAKPASLLKGFEKAVVTAKAGARRQVIFDEATTGLALIVTPKGKKSFSIVARDPAGKQVWKRIGDPAQMNVSEARSEAAQAVARVKAGEAASLPPTPRNAAPETFRAVAERFVQRHVNKQELRSKAAIERQLECYVYPEWGSEPFEAIRRGRVAELLDKIEDRTAGASGDMGGPVMADRVLATLRKLFNWYEVRNEEYASPIVRGMRVSSAKDRARKRILTDDEIRALWPDLANHGTFGAFLQTCLLTAQRRGKVLAMRWQDVSEEGVWTIPAEAREKANAGAVKLPAMALAVINAQPIIAGNPYVFAGRGSGPIGNLGHDKKRLDDRVSLGEPWTIHDLRRTARSLMARAGVRSDVAERTLGHVIAGVEGVYDRHGYSDEKAAALEALATLVGRILQGEQSNVVELGATR
ncbi:MAG: tyrosine-type recombinase/integrase [Pseudomonadota bacterium]